MWVLRGRQAIKILLCALALIAFILLTSGGVYNLTEAIKGRLYMMLPYGDRLTFIYPDVGGQLLGESIAVMILFGLGGVGCYALSRATTRLRSQEALMLLIVGLLLLTLACIGLGWLYSIKAYA